MTEARDKKSGPVFVGQLFRGDPKNKNWTPLVDGQVGVSLQQVGRVWSLVAAKKVKVWELSIEMGFKHRVRDTFVQWQKKNQDGSMETYGLRLKSSAVAQQMCDVLTQLLARLEERKKETGTTPPLPSAVAPPLPSMQPDEAVLKVFIPGRDPSNVCVPRSTTVQQILRSVCQRRDLDPAHFVATLPPVLPGGKHVLCKGHMTIGELSTNEIHLAMKRSSRESPPVPESDGKEQMVLLQVELPKGERTVIRVSPAITLPALLQYICEKRNLPVGGHRFDLPATEESLASRTLQELKISSIRVITKGVESGSNRSPVSSPSRNKKLKSKVKSQPTLEGSPGKRRNAPPPPPPGQRRRTQPEFMRELTAEMAGRKITRESHDTVAPPTGITDHVDGMEGVSESPPKEQGSPQRQKMTSGVSKGSLKPRNAPAPPPPKAQATPSPEAKPRPPPVAGKPKKRRAESFGADEPDGGVELVKPVQQDLKDDALKKQTSPVEQRHTEGRRIGLADTRHMSLEKNDDRIVGTPPLPHPVMVPVDIPDEDTGRLRQGGTLPARRHRAPAPRPPHSHRSHTMSRAPRTTTPPMTRSNGNVNSDGRTKEGFKIPRSPRKRPSRPAPVPPPAGKAVVDEEVQEKILDFKNTSPPPQESQPSPPSQRPQDSSLSQHSQGSPASQRSQGSPASQRSQASQPSPMTTQKATAVCHDTEDGGKVLIVQPSPSTDRRKPTQAPIIFKLPPPPPQPNGGKKGKKDVKKGIEEETTGGSKEQTEASVITTNEEHEGMNIKGIGDNKEQEEGTIPTASEEQDLTQVKATKKEESYTESTGNMTILSNEFTNLDDSDTSEEVSMEFSERNQDSEDELETEDREENGFHVDTDSADNGSVGGYDVTVDDGDQSDSPSKMAVNGFAHKDNGHAPLPPMDDHVTLNLSLNSNSNNSNDSADELGAPPPLPAERLDPASDSADELGAPPSPPDESPDSTHNSADELGAPPSPPDDSPSSASSMASISELTDLVTKQPSTTNEMGDILLLSYKASNIVPESPVLSEADKVQSTVASPNLESDTSIDVPNVPGVKDVEGVEVVPAVEGVEDVKEGWADNSQLRELDSVVSDLRALLSSVEEEATTVEAMPTAISEATPTSEVPPPPSGFESAEPIESVPPPPPTQSQTPHSHILEPSLSSLPPVEPDSLPPPLTEAQESLPPPLTEAQESLPPPLTEAQESLPPPLTEAQEPPPPPLTEAQESLPPPLTEAQESLPPPLTEAQEPPPPPLTEAQESLPPPLTEAQESPPPPLTESQESPPPPLTEAQVSVLKSPADRIKKSPVPPKPKPPPLISAKPSRPPTRSTPPTTITPLTKSVPTPVPPSTTITPPKPPPPPTKAKPITRSVPVTKQPPTPVTTTTETHTKVTRSTNELLEKFRKRQASTETPTANTESIPNVPSPVPVSPLSSVSVPSQTDSDKQTSTDTLAASTESIPNTSSPVPVSSPNPTVPVSSQAGSDAVQAQLQFLQQQVLQQQMLQLQQQFQQLQSLAMQSGTGMSMPGISGMAPGHYLPQAPNPMMFPGAQASPMMIGQTSLQMPPGHPGYMATPTGMPMMYSSQPMGYGNTPHNMMPNQMPSRPPLGSQPGLGSQAPPGSQPALGSQVPPGSQPPPGSQFPPGSQLPQGSHLPPGSQPPPGSQFPPGSQLPQGSQLPLGSQAPLWSQAPLGSQAPQGSQPPMWSQAPLGSQPSHLPLTSQFAQASQPPLDSQASQPPQASQVSQPPQASQLASQAPAASRPISVEKLSILPTAHLSQDPPTPGTPPPPPPSQPPPELPLSTDSPLVVRKTSGDQERRSLALGKMEDRFDALMGEVKETDPTAVLKKIPEEDPLMRDSDSPTGMAAALEVALRQRRHHFSDRRRSRDMEESFGEWQSP